MPPIINEEKAINIAIDACKTPNLVLVGEPENVHTKLLSLKEADKLTKPKGETTNYEIPMDTKAWLVQIDGRLQLIGGPKPVISNESQEVTPTPSQPFWSFPGCLILLTGGSHL